MANQPFWSTNNVEPKRSFRFQVQLGGTDGEVLWWAKSVTTPSYDVSEVEHNYLDNKYYFPGRVTWSEVSFTLVDPISVDAVSQTNKILEEMGYIVKKDATSKVTMSKIKATKPTNVVISVLDAEGEPIEVWTLNNAFLKSAKFSDLDYSSDDLRTIEVSVRYDWASCNTSGNTTDGVKNTKDSFFKQA